MDSSLIERVEWLSWSGLELHTEALRVIWSL
jgi:hypothetical protein